MPRLIVAALPILLFSMCGMSIAQNLDAHWSFDTDFTDSTGAHNGTAQGAGAVIDNGESVVGGGSVSLSGATTSYVQATGYKGVTGTAARTVAAWVKFDSPIANPPNDVNQGIFGWGTNSGGEKWTVRSQSNNGLNGALRTEINGGYIVGTTDLHDGNWHHVAATFVDDGSPDVRDVLLYVDGQLNADFGGAPAPSASAARALNTTATGIDVRIGARQANTNDNLDGFIDDAGIFTESLSAEKIEAIFDLATNSELGYDLSDDDLLFATFEQGAGASVDINGLTWQFVDSGLTPGLTGSDGAFSLGLDAASGAGLQTVAIPEPASVAIWSLIGLGLATFGYMRRRRKS